MNRRPLRLLPFLFACVAAVCGCASTASMDARYEASLLRWQGATRAELEAAWGKPTLAQAMPDGTVLTWIVRTDIDTRAGPDGPPLYTVTPTAQGTIRTVSPGMPGSAVVPITCTTRFTMKDGRVAAWKFEGLGCGAPT